MNYAALRRVRDAMAANPDRIRMDLGWGSRLDSNAIHETLFAGSAFANCDTVGCIVGWTVATLDPSFPVIKDGLAIYFTELTDHAADLLEIGPMEAKELFYGQWASPRKHLAEITPAEVIQYLDGLLAADEVRMAA